MYTRCPSCRAQISFELPQSADSFPDGYKHKIKCPSCGVTIGVKIPKVDAEATAQPTYTPANPAASNAEPTYQAAPPVPETKADRKAEKAAKKGNKKSGLGRNIVMMLFSLFFVALSVIGYLIVKGTMHVAEFANSIASFDGISFIETLIKNFEAVKGYDIPELLIGVIPAGLFVIAGIDFLVALIAAIGKKYGRAWNLIASFIMAALAVFILIAPIFFIRMQFVEYMKYVLENKQYFWIVGAGVGVVQLIFALGFLAPLKRKQK